MADLVLDWSALGAYGIYLENTESDGVTASVETGGVSVDITFTAEDAGAEAFTVNFTGYVPEDSEVDPKSHLKLLGQGGDGEGIVSPTSTTVLNFSSTNDLYGDEVQNVSFLLNDVDGGEGGDLGDLLEYTASMEGSFEDNVTVLAYDAAGNPVDVTLTVLSGGTTVDGNTATGTEVTDFAEEDGTLQVSIAGPVSRIEIVYENGGDQEQGVLISDIDFSTTDANDGVPLAEDDSATTDEDVAVVIDVLSNDSDPDGDELTVTAASATNGTVAINDDGTLTYTPDQDYNGPDEISYTVADPDGNTASALVDVTVNPVNDDPVAVDDTVGTPQETPVTFDPTENDTDVDGDPLTISSVGEPENGTVTLNDDGTLTYTPDEDFVGPDTITYTIDDGNGGEDEGTITVNVTVPTNPNQGNGNQTPVANDDTVETVEETPVTFDPTDNDTDADGDPLTVSEVGDPENGTVTINDDGTVTYTPNEGYIGDDSFTYTVDDGNGGGDEGTITVSVGEAENTPPVAVDDSIFATATGPETFDPTDNDTDADGDPLTITSLGEAENGTVTLNDDGTVTYVADEAFNGTDTFDYTVDDGNGGSDTGTVTVEVLPCFTPGTLIATPKGERLVEDLEVGDRVITRDNGIQEIRWIGRKELTGHQLARKPHLKPVLIQQGALGKNLPEHDLLVSPNHRVLVANDKTALYFEEREVLAAAKHLTGLDGVDEVDTLGVTYIHMMFDNHEVVLSNGAWTESFQPGDLSLRGIGEEQRQEIFELFPELEHAEGLKAYGAARRSLKKHEAQLLTK